MTDSFRPFGPWPDPLVRACAMCDEPFRTRTMLTTADNELVCVDCGRTIQDLVMRVTPLYVLAASREEAAYVAGIEMKLTRDQWRYIDNAERLKGLPPAFPYIVVAGFHRRKDATVVLNALVGRAGQEVNPKTYKPIGVQEAPQELPDRAVRVRVEDGDEG